MKIQAARYSNRQSGHDHPLGGARTLVVCGFDSHSCQCVVNQRVVFLAAVRKTVAINLVRR